jgi:hypothetical protein
VKCQTLDGLPERDQHDRVTRTSAGVRQMLLFSALLVSATDTKLTSLTQTLPLAQYPATPSQPKPHTNITPDL